MEVAKAKRLDGPDAAHLHKFNFSEAVTVVAEHCSETQTTIAFQLLHGCVVRSRRTDGEKRKEPYCNCGDDQDAHDLAFELS